MCNKDATSLLPDYDSIPVILSRSMTWGRGSSVTQITFKKLTGALKCIDYFGRLMPVFVRECVHWCVRVHVAFVMMGFVVCVCCLSFMR